MGRLKEVLRQELPGYRSRVKTFLAENAENVASPEVKWAQVFGGMRGIKSLPCFTSLVDPEQGVFYQNILVSDWVKSYDLDKLPERTFLMLLLGRNPDSYLLQSFIKRLQEPMNSHIPDHVWKLIKVMKDDHPMNIFSAALVAMSTDSRTHQANEDSRSADERWTSVLDDSIRLLSVIPRIVGAIYHVKYGDNFDQVRSDRSKSDMGSSLARYLNLKADTAPDLMRLYLTLHADHESGNVSAHTARLVASSWATPFQAFSASMLGLAGPLHGLANQQVLTWLQALLTEYDGIPSEKQIKEAVKSRIEQGQKIPGYGHAVLRVEDPRFTALLNFAEEKSLSGRLVPLVKKLHKVVPKVLKENTRVTNPYPNVDAASGALLFNNGLEEYEMYTVLFGASRAIGILPQLILASMLKEPIERPKSVFFSLRKPLTDQI